MPATFEVTAHHKYRSDIDGLRAVAVLSVLLFHFQVDGFPGGHVGVDVFFVISGFLITGMIVADTERGRFCLRRFYERRARRLLPALFACIALSCVVAFLMLTPEHMKAFARSAVAAIFGVSNITFWQEAGYFDLSARMKPLLHTWTLGVEWQFYLVWPALLLIFMRTRRPAILIALVGAASLLATSVAEPSTRFYLTPFRVFEFAIGALLIWAPDLDRRSGEVAIVIGLTFIGCSVATFHEIRPSYFLLLPTTGAALIIVARHATITSLVLRNPLSAYIGRISYSVYLLHWPLIVFAEYYFFRPLNRIETVAIFFASLLLGMVLHETFERPVHERKMLLDHGWAFTTGATLILLAALLPATQNGLSWRIDSNAEGVVAQSPALLTDKSIQGPIDCKRPCSFGNPAGKRILVVGDSHIDHHTKTLEELGGNDYYFDLVEAAACFNGKTVHSLNTMSSTNQKICDEARPILEKWIAERQYSAVIVGQWWPAYQGQLMKEGSSLKFTDFVSLFNLMFDETEALFLDFKGPIVFVGHAPNTNLSCYLRPSYLKMECPDIPLDLSIYESIRNAFDQFSRRTTLDVRFIDIGRIICPDKKCRTFNNEGYVLYTDICHLSIFGSRLIVPEILSNLPHNSVY